MGEALSQAEIEALLNGEALPDGGDGQSEGAGGRADGNAGAGDGAAAAAGSEPDAEVFIVGEDPSGDFSHEEVDALGEIGNISMGNSATTLFSLLNRKVNITTPTVTVSTLRQIASTYKAPLVVVRVEYTEGLIGSNMLILKESDVMVITDLMMGGTGEDVQGDITELHLSAISEAMNQMIGNSSTSLSDVYNMKIDISPPNATSVKMNDGNSLLQIVNIDPDEKVAVVTFNMTVENLLNTKLMQIQPLTFAKEMIERLVNSNKSQQAQAAPPPQAAAAAPPPQQYAQYAQPQYAQPPYQMAPPQYAQPPQYVNVQPANFQAFDDESMTFDKRNIGLVMDVPLGISVELGRTQKLIREILEFGQGSIIELDKLAGEPVDILVNGKPIAKGEVVVIDESFGVRVTDIIHPSKRLG